MHVWQQPQFWIEVAVIALLVLGVAFFSLAETALVTVNHIRMRQLMEEDEVEPTTADAVTRVLDNKQLMLATVIVGFNVCVLIAAAVTTHVTVHLWQRRDLLEIVTLAMIATVLVVGEIMPKSYGVRRAEPSAIWVARPMELIMKLFGVPVRVLMFICHCLIRLLGGRPGELHDRVSAEDLKQLVDMGEEAGVLEEQERRLMDSALALGERVAREVMVPRVDMVCLPATASIEDVLDVVTETGHSRLPLYGESVDQIIAVLHVNDVLHAVHERGGDIQGWSDFDAVALSSEPLFVPELKLLDELLSELRRRRVHLSIVVDEHGGVAGLVTIEDILEELVGEIRDEHDVEDALVELLDSGELRFDGRADTRLVEETLGIGVPEGEYDTLAGYLIHLVGDVPEPGQTVAADGVQFVVETVEDHRIRKVRARRTVNNEEAE